MLVENRAGSERALLVLILIEIGIFALTGPNFFSGANAFEIVRLGVELGAPFHVSWSCYSGETVACGVCESCLLRLRAFREAGATDPIPYASV